MRVMQSNATACFAKQEAKFPNATHFFMTRTVLYVGWPTLKIHMTLLSLPANYTEGELIPTIKTEQNMMSALVGKLQPIKNAG